MGSLHVVCDTELLCLCNAGCNGLRTGLERLCHGMADLPQRSAHGNFTRSKMPERERYLMGVKGKVAYMNQLLKNSQHLIGQGRGDPFTDLDVCHRVPFRPAAFAPDGRSKQASVHAGAPIRAARVWAVNSGFYLLRNTTLCVAFSATGGMLATNGLRDQDAANFSSIKPQRSRLGLV